MPLKRVWSWAKNNPKEVREWGILFGAIAIPFVITLGEIWSTEIHERRARKIEIFKLIRADSQKTCQIQQDNLQLIYDSFAYDLSTKERASYQSFYEQRCSSFISKLNELPEPAKQPANAKNSAESQSEEAETAYRQGLINSNRNLALQGYRIDIFYPAESETARKSAESIQKKLLSIDSLEWLHIKAKQISFFESRSIDRNQIRYHEPTERAPADILKNFLENASDSQFDLHALYRDKTSNYLSIFVHD